MSDSHFVCVICSCYSKPDESRIVFRTVHQNMRPWFTLQMNIIIITSDKIVVEGDRFRFAEQPRSWSSEAVVRLVLEDGWGLTDWLSLAVHHGSWSLALVEGAVPRWRWRALAIPLRILLREHRDWTDGVSTLQ